MPSDPAAGAPVARAPVDASVVDAARNDRIPFELLATIAVVGSAAGGHYGEAALVAFIALIGGLLLRGRRQARARGDASASASGRRIDAQPRSRAVIGTFAARVLSFFAAWFTPLALASAAAMLMRTGDVAHALTLLLVASPQALLALPPSSHVGWRALGAGAAAALLAAALAGFVGLVAAALLQLAPLVAARFVRR